MRKPSEAELAAGEAVQAAVSVADKYQSQMDMNKDLISQMRAKKSTYNTELEMLAEKGEDSLSYELKFRKIDLQKDISTLESNISNMTSEQDNIQHHIDVAGISVKSARAKYTEITAPPSVSGNLSSADIEFLKSSKPRSLQSFQEKQELIHKYGHDAFTEHCPMI